MTAIPFEMRMSALGLNLAPDEAKKLAVLVAELDVAAATVRGPRPYLEEPCLVLRLSPAVKQDGAA